MLIGFSGKSSVKRPIFLYQFFRHVVVIDNNILIQVAIDGVRAFIVGKNEISKLEKNGWIFINVEKNINYKNNFGILNCVGFAKRAIGIKNPFILTPDQLFQKLIKQPFPECRKLCQ